MWGEEEMEKGERKIIHFTVVLWAIPWAVTLDCPPQILHLLHLLLCGLVRMALKERWATFQIS